MFKIHRIEADREIGGDRSGRRPHGVETKSFDLRMMTGIHGSRGGWGEKPAIYEQPEHVLHTFGLLMEIGARAKAAQRFMHRVCGIAARPGIGTDRAEHPDDGRRTGNQRRVNPTPRVIAHAFYTRSGRDEVPRVSRLASNR